MIHDFWGVVTAMLHGNQVHHAKSNCKTGKKDCKTGRVSLCQSIFTSSDYVQVQIMYKGTRRLSMRRFRGQHASITVSQIVFYNFLNTLSSLDNLNTLKLKFLIKCLLTAND